MPALRRALALAVALLLLTVAVASAHHATPCLDAHSSFEATMGRPENVGLYLRVYGDTRTAEHRCQLEHAGEQQFTWYVPAPAPVEAPAPTTHPDYGRVVEVAQARSGQPALAASIAADVVGRGTVDAFLRGTDAGVLYGQWACDWQSDACPLAPVYVPPPPPPPPVEPLVESAALPIWRVLASTTTGEWLTDEAAARGVRVIVSDRVSSRHYADYSASRNTVRLSPELLYERPQAAAVSLGHELWHAISTIPRPRNFDRCVIDEVWAFIVGSFVWYEFYGWADPWTDYERDMWRAFRVLADHPQGEVDFDQDIADWPWMLRHVLFDRGYATSCQR